MYFPFRRYFLMERSPSSKQIKTDSSATARCDTLSLFCSNGKGDCIHFVWDRWETQL